MCSICRDQSVLPSDLVPWPGGCMHSFHAECLARHYQQHDPDTVFCPECYALQDGTPRPSRCVHGRPELCL
ncbi:MAG: RING finger domain-containing protein, partial [Candidatus Fonsibacter sp.]